MYGLGGSQASFSKFSEEVLRKSGELMAPDVYNHQHHPHQNSGLMRYQSAPSSLLGSFVDGSSVHLQSSSHETETMFARLMSGSSDSQGLQGVGAMKHEEEVMVEGVPQQNGYSNGSQMIYNSQPMQTISVHNSASPRTNMESSFMTSMAAENSMKIRNENCSSLVRQSSSPPGLFPNLTSENGFTPTREMGNLRAGNSTNVEANPSVSRLNNQISFSSGLSSCNGLIPKISEIRNENIGLHSPKDGNNSNSRCYISNFTTDSWSDSPFSGLTRMAADNDLKMFSGLNSLEAQNVDSRYRSLGLTHHLSLPKNFPQITTIEKFLHFQDSVPCKIRAKRGCATHPRSIAERVRRTRISERMRKLQELFPNMDKQTNTADMLDLAVEYIKDLQKQVKTLNDTKVKCTCSSI